MHFSWLHLILVAFGGGLGASLRWLVSCLLPQGNSVFFLPTLLCNLLGSFFIGITYALCCNSQNHFWRVLLITGFLGGFTTFSSFSLESIRLLQKAQIGLALGYMSISLLGCLAMTGLGWWLFRK